MNFERFKEIIEKIPIGLLFICFMGYLAYQVYSFKNDSESPLQVKLKEYHSAKDVRTKVSGKLTEAKNFVKTLEAKKLEIRKIAQELQGMKETLAERSDVPAFMKMTITEAKKIGVVVLSLKPGGMKEMEYYTETTFFMKFRGIFAQVVGFLDRLSNVSEIVRVENINLKLSSSNNDRFVLLEGSVDIKTYKYRGSNIDSYGKGDSLTNIESNPKPPGQQNQSLKTGSGS